MMHNWLGFSSFALTLLKVSLVWAAFYGTGRLITGAGRWRNLLPMVPPEIFGLAAFVILSIPLSLLGALNRQVCSLLILAGALPGLLLLYGKLKGHKWELSPLKVILVVLLCATAILNLTYSSMPDLAFDDPQVTYAVQPDRWLEAGRIHWLEETTFSGFPLLYEMTALWPASLSTDRMNQLGLLQLFQMTLLFVAVFRGLRILRIRGNTSIIISVIILFNSLLFVWCSLAKTDTMAILFATLALAAAVSEGEKGFKGSKLSSWFFMGLALAVKQTAVLLLLPFLLYAVRGLKRLSGRTRTAAVILLILPAGLYGLRTMIHTGSPLYPVHPIGFMVHDEWRLDEPGENTTVNTRASYLYENKDFPMAKHLGIFFACMEGCVLLLIAGTAAVLLRSPRKAAWLALPVLVYSAVAIKVFWPPWWGAKYSILIYPFTAVLGGYLLQKASASRAALISGLILIPSIVIPGFIAVASNGRPFRYRLLVAQAVLSGEWPQDSGHKMIMSTPEGMAQMWANEGLPENSVLLSIHEEKRYFYDGTVIVGWRHPVAQGLYRDNTLEEELEILRSLNVDYVGFYRTDPAVLDQENSLAILDHIGIDDILEPVIMVDGEYLYCRFNAP